MASTMSLGTVEARTTGGGGLGVTEPEPVIDPELDILLPTVPGVSATNLAERGALWRRGPVDVIAGLPQSRVDYALLSSSYLQCQIETSATSIHTNPLDIDTEFDLRWLPIASYFTPATSTTSWAPIVGSVDAIVDITSANLAAHPSTGVPIDANSEYWARTGQVNYNALTMDQNPIEIQPTGGQIGKLTIGLVATVYEGFWAYTDVIAFRDTATTNPDKAKLMSVKLAGNELQWWIRGRQVYAHNLDSEAISISPSQFLTQPRPFIFVMSIDASGVGGGTPGKANLVVVDAHSQTSKSVAFSNNGSSDIPFDVSVFVGRPGSTNYDVAPYDAAFVPALARMDLFEMGINIDTAWDLGDCQALAAKYDSIYGISQ